MSIKPDGGIMAIRVEVSKVVLPMKYSVILLQEILWKYGF